MTISSTLEINSKNMTVHLGPSHKLNRSIELSQAEKERRSLILKRLVSLLRAERFEKESNLISRLVYDSADFSKSPRFGCLDDAEIYALGICPAPSYVVNIFVCRELEKQFGDLSTAGCFNKVNSLWRLSINPCFAGSGVLLPLRAQDSGLICGLMAYRNLNDLKSFRIELEGGIL